MLVGVLTGSSVSEYHALSRNSPITLIQPPILYLSSPEEHPGVAMSDKIDEVQPVIHTRAAMFRHLYNPRTQIPGYYAAVMPSEKESSIDSVRTALGIPSKTDDFVSYFLIAHDGMRSAACRSFLRSFSNALVNMDLAFKITVADPKNPDHAIIFENFNEEANLEFQGAKAIGHSLF